MYKVLLVEDEDIIRKGLMFMVDWLKVQCVVVGEAADGEEGLALLQALQPDIVITDVKMPFKDGLAMLEEGRSQGDFEAIIISGYDEFEYAKKAITLDVTEYLLKPVDFTQLYQALEKLTQKMEEKRALRQYQQAVIRQKPDFRLEWPSRHKNKYTTRLLSHIQAHYREKVSLQELSREYGISCTYLNAKFKEDTHFTFNDFLNRYRIWQAVELLKQNTLKLYEIAELVGFPEYKYFNLVFKKYVGCSPRQFSEAVTERLPT